MAPTFAEALMMAVKLHPHDAITNDGAIKRDQCVTPLITQILMPGEAEPRRLNRVGKPGGGYVRVSTERQKQDGFSLDEQVTRVIHFFVEREQPFYIYSDAALSGFYPPKKPGLIKQMIEKHAKRYERNFNTIFLSGKGIRQYSDAERKSMEAHLKEALNTIRKAASVIYSDTGEITVIKRGVMRYRPAFTLLLDDLRKLDIVAVSDLSRLYRNEALATELGERLNEEGCTARIEGLIESLDFLNSAGNTDDMAAQMQRWFLGFIAEKYLNTLTVNTLRGTIQMLEQGKPHGKLAYFATRDKNGFAIWKPGAREAVLRLKELVESPDPETGRRRSYNQIHEIMSSSAYPPLGHKTEWGRRLVTEILSNRMLVGKHCHFGLEFELPNMRVMELDEFERLQAIIDDTKKHNARHNAKLKRTELPNEQGELEEVCYLATGLLRCVCGGRMCHHPYRGFEGYACTNQIDNKRKDVRHTRYTEKDINRFINDMMSHYKDVATLIIDKGEYEARRMELAVEQDNVIKHKVALDRLVAVLRQQYVTVSEAEGFEGDDLENLVSIRLRRATKRERQELVDAEKRRDELDAELEAYTSHAEAERINEKIEMWDNLHVREQNAILLRIFDRWEVRGNDPDCYIVPILRTGRELAPIHLVTRVQQFKKRDRANYTRRLPDAHAWYQSAKRHLMGGEWYGDVVGFQYRTDLANDPPYDEAEDTVVVTPWNDAP